MKSSLVFTVRQSDSLQAVTEKMALWSGFFVI